MMKDVRSAAWLLPICFVIHDGEELLTMPAWIADHRAVLDAIAHSGPVARLAVEQLPTTTTEVAVAIGLELLLFIAATIAFVRDPPRPLTRYLYAALLGIFVLHSATHLAQALVLRDYTPGVVSAVLAIPPTGLVVYRALFAAKLLTWAEAISSTVIGAVAFLPLFFSMLRIARWLNS